MTQFGGHSMAAPLRRVLVCKPKAAGWGRSPSDWEAQGYFHAPMPSLAEAQHYGVVKALESAGAEIAFLPEGDGLSLDAVYAHDASLVTNGGAICMHMGKPGRRGEPSTHAKLYESLAIPVLGTVTPPGLTEAGDMVWLDDHALLIGEGFRTNAEGIRQMQALLKPLDVEVLSSPLPYGPGPDACLHLMSLMSVVDERVILVDRQWLSVPTLELLKQKKFSLVLMEPSEREQMACNVLALGSKKLLAIDGNDTTNARLEREGFSLEVYSGSEISANGSGGPTCLTRPILRKQ